MTTTKPDSGAIADAMIAEATQAPWITKESIFESWDGCDYDGIDIGAALRADFAKAEILEAPRIADLEAKLAAAEAHTKKPVHEENARFAIEGAIHFGRSSVNQPPTEDHWLMPFWKLGQQLAQAEAHTLKAVEEMRDSAIECCQPNAVAREEIANLNPAAIIAGVKS